MNDIDNKDHIPTSHLGDSYRMHTHITKAYHSPPFGGGVGGEAADGKPAGAAFIVITSPSFLPDEPNLIRQLFDCGLDVLHLRKPGASVEACSRLLDALPEDCLRHIVTHDHFELCHRYGLQGIHLNRRNPEVPDSLNTGNSRFTVSASCHSIAEAAARKTDMDYVFMSPIFDSISKHGYASAYSAAELTDAAAAGIIDHRVIALGGVSLDNIQQLKDWHFGGAAFLGDVWSRAGQSDFRTHVQLLARKLHG